MLGVSDWHEHVPRDPVKNVRWRLALRTWCRDNASRQAAVMGACQADILFWINGFCWYNNPLEDEKNKVGPFILWDFQEQGMMDTLDRWCVQRKDALWEKSREMGATWMALMMQLWMCLFHQWEKFLDVSHMSDAVERAGDSDTLFWKLEFLIEHLPPWMTLGVKKRKMVFEFSKTHSAITGAASTKRSGVSGRGKVFLDELGKQENAHHIVGQTRDTGPRLFVSTHYGIGTTFNKLCERPDMWKRIFHWSQHPKKNKGLYRWDTVNDKLEKLNSNYEVVEDNGYAYGPDYPFVSNGTPVGGPFPGVRSPWYDEECLARHDPRDVAMHLDIHAAGSDSTFFNLTCIHRISRDQTRPPLWQGDLLYNPVKGIPIRLIERGSGPIKLWRLPDPYGHFPLSEYGGGIDVSTGNGSTPTVMSIGDRRTSEKILEYADASMGGERFGPYAAALSRLFKGQYRDSAMIVWEVQGIGEQFGKSLLQTGYRGVYTHTTGLPFKLTTIHTRNPGWSSSSQSRLSLLLEYREALEKGFLKNYSKQAVEECAKFRWSDDGYVEHALSKETDDPSQARHNHADRVFADALMWMMMKKLGVEQKKQEENRKPAVGSWLWRRQEAEALDRMADEDAA